MANRNYRRYRNGGKSVPGMYKATDGNGENELNDGTLPTVTNQADSLAVANSLNTRNNIVNLQMQNAVMQNQQIQALMQQLKLQNDSLQNQNTLLSTKIEKMDLIHQ